jgi:hypothetical protein
MATSKVDGLHHYFRTTPIVEGRYQLGTPQDINGRNFILKRDLTRASIKNMRLPCATGNNFAGSQAGPILHHLVERRIALGSGCV